MMFFKYTFIIALVAIRTADGAERLSLLRQERTPSNEAAVTEDAASNIDFAGASTRFFASAVQSDTRKLTLTHLIPILFYPVRAAEAKLISKLNHGTKGNGFEDEDDLELWEASKGGALKGSSKKSNNSPRSVKGVTVAKQGMICR